MTTTPTLTARVWAELLLLGLIWGGVFLAVRVSLDELGFVTAVAHRVFWAALLLWAYVLWRRLPLPGTGRGWMALFVMGLLNNVIPFSLMAWGQLHIPSGLASVFNASTAIFGALVAALLLADERLTRRKAFGIAIGFAGVVLAIGPRALVALDITSLAQLAVVGGALSYALAGAWARVHLRDLRPEVAAAGMLTGAALIMGPAAVVIEGTPSVDLRPATWAAVLYVVVVATAGAYLLYYRILAMAGAANTMLVTLIIPPVSILLGALVRHETLGIHVFAGLGLLALGLVILDGRLFNRYPLGKAASQDRPTPGRNRADR